MPASNISQLSSCLVFISYYDYLAKEIDGRRPGGYVRKSVCVERAEQMSE